MSPCYTTSTVSTHEEREIVYRIRQQAYRSSDVDIDDHPLKDEYDDRVNSISHLLYQDDIPVGTIRASLYTSEFHRLPVPAMEQYGDEITEKFGRQIAYAQSSYFAVAPSGRLLSHYPKAMLFRALSTTVMGYDIKWIVTIVRNRPTQLSFYAKLGFQPIAAPQLHRQVNRVGVLLCTTTQNFSDWAESQLIELG